MRHEHSVHRAQQRAGAAPNTATAQSDAMIVNSHEPEGGRPPERVRAETAAMLDRRAAEDEPYAFIGLPSSVTGPSPALIRRPARRHWAAGHYAAGRVRGRARVPHGRSCEAPAAPRVEAPPPLRVRG
ncbi:hypothetical protein [Actinomadura sediminis]|uniref:Uncharacterized protein n=1 Tax=Actinomadura sediminis TaxID=1038904 RepID=A0ABW3EQ59_9ACTN